MVLLPRMMQFTHTLISHTLSSHTLSPHTSSHLTHPHLTHTLASHLSTHQHSHLTHIRTTPFTHPLTSLFINTPSSTHDIPLHQVRRIIGNAQCRRPVTRQAHHLSTVLEYDDGGIQGSLRHPHVIHESRGGCHKSVCSH